MMSSDTLNTDQLEDLLNGLQAVLEKQEERIRENDFRNVEALCVKADSIILELAKISLPRHPQWQKRCEQLTRQYKKLELMVESARESILRQLEKVGTGKKLIRMYRHHD